MLWMWTFPSLDPSTPVAILITTFDPSSKYMRASETGLKITFVQCHHFFSLETPCLTCAKTFYNKWILRVVGIKWGRADHMWRLCIAPLCSRSTRVFYVIGLLRVVPLDDISEKIVTRRTEKLGTPHGDSQFGVCFVRHRDFAPLTVCNCCGLC